MPHSGFASGWLVCGSPCKARVPWPFRASLQPPSWRLLYAQVVAAWVLHVPLCSSGIFLTLGGEAFFGGLGFGSDVDLGFAGFRSRRLSPGFSRVGVDEGLLSGSYLPPNLLGIGTLSAKVAPTTRLCGVVLSLKWSSMGGSPQGAGRPVCAECAWTITLADSRPCGVFSLLLVSGAPPPRRGFRLDIPGPHGERGHTPASAGRSFLTVAGFWEVSGFPPSVRGWRGFPQFPTVSWVLTGADPRTGGACLSVWPISSP